MSFCNSVESVNDGLFHSVELLIQNRSLSLVVDNGAPKSLSKLTRQPSVDHNTQLYIGGMCILCGVLNHVYCVVRNGAQTANVLGARFSIYV